MRAKMAGRGQRAHATARCGKDGARAARGGAVTAYAHMRARARAKQRARRRRVARLQKSGDMSLAVAARRERNSATLLSNVPTSDVHARRASAYARRSRRVIGIIIIDLSFSSFSFILLLLIYHLIIIIIINNNY